MSYLSWLFLLWIRAVALGIEDRMNTNSRWRSKCTETHRNIQNKHTGCQAVYIPPNIAKSRLEIIASTSPFLDDFLCQQKTITLWSLHKRLAALNWIEFLCFIETSQSRVHLKEVTPRWVCIITHKNQTRLRMQIKSNWKTKYYYLV